MVGVGSYRADSRGHGRGDEVEMTERDFDATSHRPEIHGPSVEQKFMARRLSLGSPSCVFGSMSLDCLTCSVFTVC